MNEMLTNFNNPKPTIWYLAVLVNVLGALEYHLVKYQCIAPTLNPLKKSVLDHFGTNCTSMEPNALKCRMAKP